MRQAARIGITEPAFWQMTPKCFRRRVDAWRWTEERKAETWAEREKVRFFHTLNAGGIAFHGKSWKWIEPADETKEVEDFDARWERAMEQERRYVERLHGGD